MKQQFPEMFEEKFPDESLFTRKDKVWATLSREEKHDIEASFEEAMIIDMIRARRKDLLAQGLLSKEDLDV